LGLVNEYKNKNFEIDKYLKTIFVLSFLNPPDVNDCFTDDLIFILPQGYRVECFADYILGNYTSESSQYPPAIGLHLHIHWRGPPTFVNLFIRKSMLCFIQPI